MLDAAARAAIQMDQPPVRSDLEAALQLMELNASADLSERRACENTGIPPTTSQPADTRIHDIKR